MLRQYLLDSLLLFYNAWFRPARLQQRLNAWVPPAKSGEDTQWWGTILGFFESRQAARVWLFCLPWWLMGALLLPLLAGNALPTAGLVVLVPLLVLVGWGVTVLSPALGLLVPALLAVGWGAQPQAGPHLWEVYNASLRSWLTARSGLLAALLAVAAGSDASLLYALLRRGHWRGARVVQGGAGIVVGLLTGLLVGGAAGVGWGIGAGVLAGGVTGTLLFGIREKDVGNEAGSVAGGMAGGVALGVAGGVAGSVAGGVAGVVAGGVALGVAGVVAGSVAGGVAGVVAGIVAFVVALGVAGIVAGIVAFVVAGGVAGGVALGVAGGVTGLALLPPVVAWPLLVLIAAALGRRPRWWGALLVAVVLAALRVENAGWLDAGLVFVLTLLAYYRLPWQVAPWLAGQWAYGRVTAPRFQVFGRWTWAFEPQSALAALAGVPPFSDETARLRVPHLDDLLALAVREDREAALRAVEAVAQSRYQAWAAPRAYAQMAADAATQYTTLESIAQATHEITWLPEDLSALPPDAAQVWPRLQALSRDVAAALASESAYTRRQGLSHARDALVALRQQLFGMGKIALQRWQPVVEHWDSVLARELERPLLAEGAALVNPYDAGNPIRLHRAALFRGRRDLVERVAGALLERNRPTLVLHGPRRMGKTSFLLQLPRLLPGRVVPVFVDLQRAANTESTWRFLYAVARATVNDARSGSRLSLPTPERAAFEREPFGAFGDWLDDAVSPALQQAGQFTLLLTFDEFEKLGQALEMGRVEERVLDELRHTIQHRQAVSVLFAGVQTLDDLGPRWSSYFISVRPLRIGYLAPDEAADLVRHPDPNVEFPLEYSDAAVDNILRATRCHPYLVQLVCSAVVDLANARRTLLATPDLVAEAQTQALERGEPYFRNLWDETPGDDVTTLSAGRRILRAVAEAGVWPLPSPDGRGAGDEAAARALERLLRHDVLERVAGGVKFQVPLVQRWIRERAPVA
jgi:hypothetical protein